MNGKNRIRAEALNAGYGTQDIVKAINCTFDSGTFTGIIGPNGSGKTTLLRAFSSVIPSTGILELEGKDVRDFTPAELGMALGFVPQDEPRPFSYTVMQVVLMARYARTSRFSALSCKDYARCHSALEDSGIAHLADRSIRTLSGGEWQRVLIARALAQETSVLLLDEPTSHLDLAHQSEILSLMRNLTGSGATVIGVFHDLNLAALYCDRLIMIRNGQVFADGIPAEVLTPQKIREVYGAEVVTSCHPATGRTFLIPIKTAKGNASDFEPLHVHVISGGGSGTALLHFLADRGVSVSAGILATTDTDYLTATAMGIPCIPVLPFTEIPAPAIDRFKEMLRKADRIIISAHPVGAGNLSVLHAIQEVNPSRVIIHMPEGTDFMSLDFSNGYAAAAYRNLCATGARCTSTYDGILRFLLPDIYGE